MYNCICCYFDGFFLRLFQYILWPLGNNEAIFLLICHSRLSICILLFFLRGFWCSEVTQQTCTVAILDTLLRNGAMEWVQKCLEGLELQTCSQALMIDLICWLFTHSLFIVLRRRNTKSKAAYWFCLHLILFYFSLFMFWQILSNAEKQDWPEESNHKINHIHATSLLWDLFVVISIFKNIILLYFSHFIVQISTMHLY